jgi:acetyl esterase/lipase
MSFLRAKLSHRSMILMGRWAGIFLLTLMIRMHLSAAPQQIALWPPGAPGEKATSEPEKDMTTAKDALVAGKPVIRLGNVTEPNITVYRPAEARDTGSAVVIFPGGGYRILALDLEGTEICHWLNSLGITAVLLKYRVPEPAGAPRYTEPLQDAQRAVSLVRSHARDWKLNPDRIGVLGFSAGGHLAAVLSAKFGSRTYPPVDGADQVSCRPNFVVFVYPAYLSVRDEGKQLAPEVAVDAHMGPTFIVQAEDDHAFIGGTLLYYRALQQGGVPAEMHIFPSGGHGYGLRPSAARVTSWPTLAESWLRSIKVLGEGKETGSR